jgi:release factor glutamine methyltransferase
MTIGEYARARARALATTSGASIDDALRDVGVLMQYTLGWDAVTWLTRQREKMPDSLTAVVDHLVHRRSLGEPVAYLLGEREFYGRSFSVNADVLIPRPETEMLVERAVALIAARDSPPEPVRVLDIGTGSGCIAVSIACEHPGAVVVAIDVSSAALAIARANALRHGVANRVSFAHGSLTAGAVDVDLILTNPPYVAEADRNELMRDVRDFEPAGALFGGPDGLAVIRTLIPDAIRALSAGGVILMEIGAGQADRVVDLLDRAGFEGITARRDLAGIERMVEARRPERSV